MKQFIINAVFYKKIFNNVLSIIPGSKYVTLGFIIATLLCNHQQGFCVEAIAQNSNPNSLPSDRAPVIPLPSDVLPQREQQEPLVPPSQPRENQIPGQDDSNVKFKVDRIEIVGSTIFKPKDFLPVTSPYIGRELTFAELLQVKDAVTKLYTDKGYVTTGAVITPQTLESGVIKIQVIEGTLQEIKVVGNRRLNSKYIRSRMIGASR